MNTVKIMSGKYRGRVLSTPGGATHPMGAREKLALFNMLAPYLEGSLVLDAYAGSGALGIEALSRGALKATFIEKNRAAARVIMQNLADLSLVGNVYAGPVQQFESGELFDLILADPPYDDFRLEEIASLAQFLSSDGILALSHPDEAPEIAGLKLLKTNQYAAAHLSLYVKQ